MMCKHTVGGCVCVFGIIVGWECYCMPLPPGLKNSVSTTVPPQGVPCIDFDILSISSFKRGRLRTLGQGQIYGTSFIQPDKQTRLITGQDLTRGSDQELFKISPAGPGQEVFQTLTGWVGSGPPSPTRPDP